VRHRLGLATGAQVRVC